MNPDKTYGKMTNKRSKSRNNEEPKQQKVETLVKILIQRKYTPWWKAPTSYWNIEYHMLEFERRRENHEEAIGYFKTIQPK